MLWEQCWLPILLALGEGSKDSRPAVRSECIAALASAIVDRHSEVVPVQLMTRILQEIVIPSFTQAGGVLLNIDVDDNAEGKFIYDDQNLSSTGLCIDTSVVIDSSTAISEPAGKHTAGVLIKAICNLSEAFIDLLPRLASFPQTFVQLWLCILRLLGHYLGSPDGLKYSCTPKLTGDIEVDKADKKADDSHLLSLDAIKVIETAKAELRGLLTVAKGANLFTSLHDTDNDNLGQDLLERTKSICSLFSFCPKLVEEVLTI
jgi:hypothetical protein